MGIGLVVLLYSKNATGDVDAYYMITCGNVVGGKGVDVCKGGE